MDKPMCLIENRPDEKLQVNQKALSILQDIQQPVVVVAIVGLYRTGKSYLMNKLAGKDKGFCLGSTIQAETMGIWMWCLPHPEMRDHTLVLLDTEGLGDVEKSNIENDSWIFALSILLSSTFVYNSMGTIDQFALEKLQYVTELTKRIKVKSLPGERSMEEEEKQDDFVRFFPAFIWVVRDFTLKLKLNDGRSISSDEYLEKALQRKKGQPERLDLAKKCIRQYFPSRKCFVFDRPASRHNLENLENVPESELSPDFVVQSSRFRRFIYENARTKVIEGGHKVTGTMLGQLAVTYVEAICNGAVPCIENAVVTLAWIENGAAVQDALTHYRTKMQELVKVPTETIEELLEAHTQCEKEAIRVFLARAFRDEKHEHQKQLANQLQAKLVELCSQNQQASSEHCQALLTELFQELEEKIISGCYSVPGGYQQFLDDQREKVEQYDLEPGKGIMASKVLQDFLKSKEATVQSILQADLNLTDQQKKTEVEQIRAENAQREATLQKQMKEDAVRMAEEQKRSFEEHKAQLIKKMEEDRKILIEEHERVMNTKLEEQRRLQQEGFQKEAQRLQKQIQEMRNSLSKKPPSCVIL